MDNKISELSKFIEHMNPTDWDSIPDIDLYIDQVLDYMKRQHPGLNLNETLTSSMVNNYAKQGLMPRAKGKKYTKEHIACLTTICLLKQIVSVSDTRTILKNMTDETSYKDFYTDYLEIFNNQADKLHYFLKEEAADKSDDNIYRTIIKMAVNSYLYKFACEYLIASLKEDGEKNDK